MKADKIEKEKGVIMKRIIKSPKIIEKFEKKNYKFLRVIILGIKCTSQVFTNRIKNYIRQPC